MVSCVCVRSWALTTVTVAFWVTISKVSVSAKQDTHFTRIVFSVLYTVMHLLCLSWLSFLCSYCSFFITELKLNILCKQTKIRTQSLFKVKDLTKLDLYSMNNIRGQISVCVDKREVSNYDTAWPFTITLYRSCFKEQPILVFLITC